jgi:hypothetical protein
MDKNEIKSRVKVFFRRMTKYNIVFGNTDAAALPNANQALLSVREDMIQINIGDAKMKLLVDGLCRLKNIVLHRSSHNYDFAVMTYNDFNDISNYRPFFEGVINIIFPAITILWRDNTMAGSFTVNGYNGTVQYREATRDFNIQVELTQNAIAEGIHSDLTSLLYSMNNRLKKIETLTYGEE